MTSSNTPVQQTGGIGFGFEDDIAARLFLSLLRGEFFFGPDFGTPIRLDFQAGESGWFLDDLLATCALNSRAFVNVAISVKIPKQVTAGRGFDVSFVDAVWDQWYATDTGPFVRERDLLCLATANVADSVLKAWNELLKEALATTSNRFLNRIKKASATKRAFFKSLEPDPQKYPGVNKNDVVALLQRLRLLKFDFLMDPSREEALALTQCRHVLRSEQPRTARDLWMELTGLAKRLRECGGSMDVSQLVTTLQQRNFPLAQHPSYANDWVKLVDLSKSLQSGIRTTIGEGFCLERPEQRQEIRTQVDATDVLVILGPSGVGKSGIVVQETELSEANIVWLNQSHLDFADATQQQIALGLEHELTELLHSSTFADNILVIDALDSFSEQSLHMLGRVIDRLPLGQSTTWKLMATCQTHVWDRVHTTLVSRPHFRPNVYELPALQPKEIPAIFQACGIATFSQEPGALGFLTNLKILDWVVQTLQCNPNALQAKSASTKSIMEAVWTFWEGVGQEKYAAGKLLRSLAVDESLSFSKGKACDDLSIPALSLLPALEQRDVVRKEGDSIFFSHDLIADWIRFRWLLNSGQQTTDLRQRAANPVWHSAIRLYGQSLLDDDEDTESPWQHMQESVRDSTTAGDVAGDLLLDAVFFHPNAYSILTNSRNFLLADEVDLFSRMIKRFLLVATVADPQVSVVTNEQDTRLLLESRMRIPLWSCWPSMLNFLFDNVEHIVDHSSETVSKICALWLQTTPLKSEDGTPFPLRKESANIALLLAREVQARQLEGAWYRGTEKNYWEAALAAAADLPDEVGALALELSCRRPVSDEIQSRVAAHQFKVQRERSKRAKDSSTMPHKRRPTFFVPTHHGEKREPWSIGPADGVDQGFRSVVWSTGALKGLIATSPDVAAEVFLALCVEAPQFESEGGYGIGKSGIDYWRIEMPDSYFNGPMLTFLRINGRVGVKTILDLANFATERWCNDFVEHNPGSKPPNIALQIDSKEVLWFGDSQVYGWFRGEAGIACSVNCALMALEKWLYDQIDEEKDISEIIRTILLENHSVAVAGILCAIGKKKPELFFGQLRPLMGAADIYEWDHNIIAKDDLGGMDFLSWGKFGEVAFETIKSWHTLAHRRIKLRELAQSMMLMNQDIQSFFLAQIQKWTKSGERYEFLREYLDIRNYSEGAEPDGAPFWEFTYPAKLEKKRADFQAENEIALQILQLPRVCEQLIETEGTLASDQLEPFVEQLQTLDNTTEVHTDHFITERTPAAIVAGIYLVLSRHRDWLTDHPDVSAWCESYLEKTFNDPPLTSDWDTPNTIGDFGWDYFAGNAAVLMLIKKPDSMVWREAAAKSITAYHYSTTASVLKIAFKYRVDLGADFKRLVNLAKLWSAVESVYGGTQEPRKLTRYKDRLVQAFCRRSISDNKVSLSRLAAAGRRFHIRRRLRAHEPSSIEDRRLADARIRKGYTTGLNWMLALSAVKWLPARLSDYGGKDLSEFKDEYMDVLKYCLEEAPTHKDDPKERIVPNDFIRWFLERIAVLAMDLEAAQVRLLWQPIMDLGSAAHYWVEDFVSFWFLTGTKHASTPQGFFDRWEELVTYTLDSPVWQSRKYRDYYQSRAIRGVMGLRAGASVIGAHEYSEPLGTMIDHYERWASIWLSDSEAASEFAAFLTRPGAGPLVPAGIRWLGQHVVDCKDYHWQENGLETNLVTALQRAWMEFRGVILENEGEREAFFGLLSILVQRQNEPAIVLQSEVRAVSPIRPRS